MNPITNPFAPGAGTPPPELAGRDELLKTIHIAIERTRRGFPTKSVLLVGLRGVGKTVLLDRMRDNAASSGIQTLRIEAPENRSLPALLATSTPFMPTSAFQKRKSQRAGSAGTAWTRRFRKI